MWSIAFDDDAAAALIEAATTAASRLREQSAQRRASAEIAADEFRGAYGDLFADVCTIESEDRVKLASELEALAEHVTQAQQAAEQERERLQNLADWWDRAPQRQQARQAWADSPLGPTVLAFDLDPKPSETPVAPPTISAVFDARERPRVSAAGSSSGTNSAVPANLRSFVTDSRGRNAALSWRQSRLSTVWSRFRATSFWAPIGSVTVVTGFTRYLNENDADADWIDGIADAFEEAGGGELSDVVLALVTGADDLDALGELLLGGDLAPAEVADVWETLTSTPRFNQERFIDAHSFELASMNGLPFSVMSRAGISALEYALDPDNPDQLLDAYDRMGFGLFGPNLGSFRNDLEAIREALDRAQATSGPFDTVQLVSFGQHNNQVTAGISFGDLDEASTVGVLTHGMTSSVHGITDSFESFAEIRDEDLDTAMVSWIGYDSPWYHEEVLQGHANEGAQELASFLDGIAVQREGNPIERLVAMGHSYGSNVVAEALQITMADVDAFVAIGSAGLQVNTTANDLGVSEIYATEADSDSWAGIGRTVHFRWRHEDGGHWLYESRVDPGELDGARTFTSEESSSGRGVTSHSLHDSEKDDMVGYLHPESSAVEGLRSIMRGELP